MVDSDAPILQYAFFCREIISEDTPESKAITFKSVLEHINVERPKHVELLLVLGLRNIPIGKHQITAKCLIDTLENPLFFKMPFTAEKELERKQLELTLRLPIKMTSRYLFTIYFNLHTLIVLPLFVTVISSQ